MVVITFHFFPTIKLINMTITYDLRMSTEKPTVKQASWKAAINTMYSIMFRPHFTNIVYLCILKFKTPNVIVVSKSIDVPSDDGL